MDKISLENLNENSFFHFTKKDNLTDISINGLKSIIGENAFGLEKDAKIFFSQGEQGVLKVMEVWLRWLMNKIHGINDRLEIYHGESIDERNNRLSKWVREFISGDYLEDTQKKEILFEYFYNYLKERVYLVLDLEEEKDFDKFDLDATKVKLKKSNNYIDQKFAKIMYGPFSNFDVNTMDDWNMHTKVNQTVDPDKIKQVIDSHGNESVLLILMEIYDKFKNIEHPKFLLDDFIEYAKKRMMMDEIIREEEKLVDQDNNRRIN